MVHMPRAGVRVAPGPSETFEPAYERGDRAGGEGEAATELAWGHRPERVERLEGVVVAASRPDSAAQAGDPTVSFHGEAAEKQEHLEALGGVVAQLGHEGTLADFS